MATTPGTSLASTACFSTPSIRVRACMALSWASARPMPTDAAAVMATAPFNTSRRLCGVGVMSGSFLFGAGASTSRGIQSHDLVEPSKSNVERRVGDQLDDLGLREMTPHLGPELVVDLAVVDGQLLREPERRPLARADEVGGLVVDRGDLRFRRPRMPGPGIAQGESVAAPVEAGDLDPDQLAQHRVDRALARQRGAEGGERLEHGRALRVGARARRGARLALRVLAQVPDLLVDLLDTERLDPRHRRLLFLDGSSGMEAQSAGNARGDRDLHEQLRRIQRGHGHGGPRRLVRREVLRVLLVVGRELLHPCQVRGRREHIVERRAGGGQDQLDALQDVAGLFPHVLAELPGDLFFFQAEDGIRDLYVTGVQTCALPISIKTYDESLGVLRRSLDAAKVG